MCAGVVVDTIHASDYSDEVKHKAAFYLESGLFNDLEETFGVATGSSEGPLKALEAYARPWTKSDLAVALKTAVSFGKECRKENIVTEPINSEARKLEDQASLLTQEVAKAVAAHVGIGFSALVRQPAGLNLPTMNAPAAAVAVAVR